MSRDLLWRCLGDMGIHGDFLQNIKNMYKKVTIKVCDKGCVSESFESKIGVKQGDPLSPLLFGLFIDRIEKVLENMCPHVGVEIRNLLGEGMIRVLLYADDLVLLAEDAQGLQQLLEALDSFCSNQGMEVNVKKTEVVIFNKKWAHRNHNEVFTVKNNTIQVVDQFTYLGVLFDGDVGTRRAAKSSLTKGRRAMFAMLRRCTALGIDNVHVKCHLFDHLVVPILCYGCEIWGADIIKSCRNLEDSRQVKEIEKMHRKFLKICLGVRDSTPDGIVMYELRRQPIIIKIVKQIFNFWNRIQVRDDDEDLVKMAMRDNWNLAMNGKKCWSSVVKDLVAEYGEIEINHDNLIDTEEMVYRMGEKWIEGISRHNELGIRDIPDCHRRGFKAFTYFHWFAQDPETSKRTTFWYNLNIWSRIQVVARFRLGSHHLEIEKGRWNRNYVCRSHRICRMCNLRVREDELHIMYCPSYFEFRCQYPNIFQYGWWRCDNEDVAMNWIMNGGSSDTRNYWNDLAVFLQKCWRKRHEVLENMSREDIVE